MFGTTTLGGAVGGYPTTVGAPMMGGAVMGAPMVETFASAPVMGASYGTSVIGTQMGAPVDLGTAVWTKND
jgi:hypothetical protein